MKKPKPRKSDFTKNSSFEIKRDPCLILISYHIDIVKTIQIAFISGMGFWTNDFLLQEQGGGIPYLKKYA